jgi:hypothetical protein
MFHGRFDEARYFGGFQYKIGAQPAAKTAAHAREFQRNFLHGNVEQLGYLIARGLGHLHRTGEFHLVGLHMGEEIHRLHGRVREEGALVFGFHHFGGACEYGLDVAVFALRIGFPVGHQIGKQAVVVCGAFEGTFFFIFRFERLARFFHFPGRFSNDGHVVFKRYDVYDAGHGFGGRAVERFEFHTKGGRVLHHRDQHAFALVVEAEQRFSRENGVIVNAFYPGSDEFEVFGVFERHVLGRRDFGGICGEFAVGQLFAARVFHQTFFGAALGGAHAPAFGGGFHEHLARGGPGLAQAFPGVRRGLAAAGHLAFEFGGVQRRLHHFYHCPVAVQLFGDGHGERGFDALSDLRVGRKNGDRTVAVDGQVGVEVETALQDGDARFEFLWRKRVETQKQTAAHDGSVSKKIAPVML